MIGSSAQGNLVVAEKVVREGTTRTREKTRKEEEGRARWLQIEPLRSTMRPIESSVERRRPRISRVCISVYVYMASPELQPSSGIVTTLRPWRKRRRSWQFAEKRKRERKEERAARCWKLNH